MCIISDKQIDINNNNITHTSTTRSVVTYEQIRQRNTNQSLILCPECDKENKTKKVNSLFIWRIFMLCLQSKRTTWNM